MEHRGGRGRKPGSGCAMTCCDTWTYHGSAALEGSGRGTGSPGVQLPGAALPLWATWTRGPGSSEGDILETSRVFCDRNTPRKPIFSLRQFFPSSFPPSLCSSFLSSFLLSSLRPPNKITDRQRGRREGSVEGARWEVGVQP